MWVGRRDNDSLAKHTVVAAKVSVIGLRLESCLHRGRKWFMTKGLKDDDDYVPHVEQIVKANSTLCAEEIVVINAGAAAG